MRDMAAELRELRGLSEATQKQFEEQQKKATGEDDEMPEPLMTMLQWKALLESNKKASSLPLTPVKAGLFSLCRLHARKSRPRQGRFYNQHRQLGLPAPPRGT